MNAQLCSPGHSSGAAGTAGSARLLWSVLPHAMAGATSLFQGKANFCLAPAVNKHLGILFHAAVAVLHSLPHVG